MNTFYVDSNGDKKICKVDFSHISKIKYDDVVDRSMFRPDSEQVRNFGLSGAGSNGSPVYDKDVPSDDEVRIRQGKYDKAEVAMIMRNKVKEFAESNDKEQKDKIKAESDAIAKARQDFLDKATGFTGSPKGSVEA